MRWNQPGEWERSADITHPAIISPEIYSAAQRVRPTGIHRPTVKTRTSRRLPYILSGLIHCGICGRRMTGQPNNDQAHYRCRYPAEYALAKGVEHPKTVYVREAL